MSGLCHVHPHLGKACHKVRTGTIAVNLIRPGFEPDLPEASRELQLSTGALREKFWEILLKEDLDLSGLREATATFQFSGSQWPSGCYVEAITLEGATFGATVDSFGSPGEILRGT